MSLFVASLNSGSNGNCYYVGSEHEAVLIDAGISCRETEMRLKRLELSIKKVKAIFITHEHSDHVGGLARLSRRHQLPVYITPNTQHGGRILLPEHLVNSFTAHQPIQIGALSIIPFPKMHDAADAHSFIIRHNETTVGVITDIGVACENVITYFKQCHAVILESNYDERMLEEGRYPFHLKNRIRGGLGHISNLQAYQLYKEHRSPFMSHLFLGHLSKNNNKPSLVKQIFFNENEETKIVIASRDKESKVYHITGKQHLLKQPVTFHQQLTLFS